MLQPGADGRNRRGRRDGEFVASAASENPEHIPNHPGFSAAGTHEAQLSAISSARSRKRPTSRPMTAAGAMPKFDGAEYRPPIVGTPREMCRNPRACASFWSEIRDL